MTLNAISQLIDHSLLHPAMTDQEIVQGCTAAARLGVRTVCVKPCAVPVARQALFKSQVQLCTVAGFPHGDAMTAVKLREVQEALAAGVCEVDVVVNIGKVLSEQYDYVKEEIRALVRLCHRPGAVIKIIFENDYLQDKHIIELCRICSEAGVDFIKTSTGFGFVRQADGRYDMRGAVEAQVRLMRAHADRRVQIKASGGIRTLDALLLFQSLGCTRIGTSATESIMDEARRRGWQ